MQKLEKSITMMKYLLQILRITWDFLLVLFSITCRKVILLKQIAKTPMKKISLMFFIFLVFFVYFWNSFLCFNISKSMLILLLVTNIYIILIIIVILYPKFGHYIITSFFIKKYKETQIIGSMLISIWTCFIFQGEPLWLYNSMIESLLQNNNPNIATVYLLQIMENYLRNCPEHIQKNMAISMALLDKIILETNVMTKIDVNEVIQRYKTLLLQYNIETLPTNPLIKINALTDKQAEYFMLYCLNNIMENPLWHSFADKINSKNHYFYFYSDIIADIAEKQKPFNNFLFGNLAHLYYKYIENYTYYSFETVIITTENAQIDIPMQPDLNIHPDKPSNEVKAIRWAGHYNTDRKYLINSTPLIMIALVGVVLVIIIEKIS